MVWRRLFQRNPEPENQENTASGEEAGDHTTSIDRNPPVNEDPGDPGTRKLPDHLAAQFAERQRSPDEADDPRRKLATFKRRRNAVLYDIEQGELAQADNNPWKQRIALLNETLEIVESDHRDVSEVEAAPFHPLPETPITDIGVTFENGVATVCFTVREQQFTYEEPLDWAERGHQITRGDLVRTGGEIEPLIPQDTPAGLRADLQNHLELSLFVLATELRDLDLHDEPLPSAITLADLAKQCPTCGGWADYMGRCQACARRAAQLQELFRERDRLLNERAAEMEEQHRLAERLPVARRRLADIDNEIARLEQQIADESA